MPRVFAYLSMFPMHAYFLFHYNVYKLQLRSYNLTLAIRLIPMFRDVKSNEA